MTESSTYSSTNRVYDFGHGYSGQIGQPGNAGEPGGVGYPGNPGRPGEAGKWGSPGRSGAQGMPVIEPYSDWFHVLQFILF
jgi:hypothetical protein